MDFIKRIMILRLIVIVACIVTVSCGVLHGRVWEFRQETIENLAIYSELIIEGTITNIHVDSLYEPSLYRTNLITELTVAIDTLWAGSYELDTICVTYRGGVIPGVRAEGWAHNREDLTSDDRVIMFVDYVEDFYNRYRPKDYGIFVIGRDIVSKDGERTGDIDTIKALLRDAVDKQSLIK
jgi:hypothetical protein